MSVISDESTKQYDVSMLHKLNITRGSSFERALYFPSAKQSHANVERLIKVQCECKPVEEWEGGTNVPGHSIRQSCRI